MKSKGLLLFQDPVGQIRGERAKPRMEYFRWGSSKSEDTGGRMEASERESKSGE